MGNADANLAANGMEERKWVRVMDAVLDECDGVDENPRRWNTVAKRTYDHPRHDNALYATR